IVLKMVVSLREFDFNFILNQNGPQLDFLNLVNLINLSDFVQNVKPGKYRPSDKKRSTGKIKNIAFMVKYVADYCYDFCLAIEENSKFLNEHREMVYRLLLQTIKIYANIRPNVPFLFIKVTNLYSIMEEIKLIPNFFADFHYNLMSQIISNDKMTFLDGKLKLFQVNLFFFTQRMCIFDNGNEFVENSLQSSLETILVTRDLFFDFLKSLEFAVLQSKNEIRQLKNFVFKSLGIIEIILKLFLSTNQSFEIIGYISILKESFKKILSFKNNDEQSFIIVNLGFYFFSYLKKLFVKRDYEINIRLEILELAFKIATYQHKALCSFYSSNNPNMPQCESLTGLLFIKSIEAFKFVNYILVPELIRPVCENMEKLLHLFFDLDKQFVNVLKSLNNIKTLSPLSNSISKEINDLKSLIISMIGKIANQIPIDAKENLSKILTCELFKI
ncbi:hypothetical protein BpHYR1_051823, partial [Brachionus plicatilis]